MSLFHPVSIGGLKLEGNLFLAPLAGYTDKVYRSICLSHGAALAWTEMVSAEGIFRKSANTVRLMERGENELNLAIQLFMPNADTAERAVPGVMEYRPQLLDINCGCPVPKVIKTGAGSALLCRPEEIHNIVSVLVRSTGLPVTVKIRTGWDRNSINFQKTAEAAFSAGASAVCMHARTRSQLYMPEADWSALKELKRLFPEKVIIGSGDLFTALDGKNMLEETGVDAVVFARGAIGNPFIFEQTRALLEGTEYREPDTAEKISAIFSHLNGLCEYLGENTACREMRKHVCAYLKGIKNSAKVRQLCTSALTVDDYKAALSFLQEIK